MKTLLTSEQIAGIEIDHAGQAKELLSVTDNFEILNDEQAGLAADWVNKMKAVFEEMESQRKGLGQDALTFTKSLNAKFKTLTGPLQDREKWLRGILTNYNRHKRQEAERAARDAEAKQRKWEQEQEAAKQEALDNDQPAPAAKPPPPPPPPASNAPVYGQHGGGMIWVSNWKHKVTDITRVPLKFLMVNDEAVKAAIKEGKRDDAIPGIKIWDDGRTRTA